MSTEELAWVALNLAHGVNRVCLHDMIEKGSSALEALQDPARRVEMLRKEPRSSTQLLDEAAAETDRAKHLGYSLLTISSPRYPGALREIYDPPVAIYTVGHLPPDGGLAIVGSRSASHYGISVARSLAREVSGHGVPVVSGFARGIDTAAHLGALDAGGTTVAVLGSGFLHPYPRENLALIPKVADKGCVLTEFPLDTKPLPMNFPLRNRIIAGLGTRGTLVVEAAERSGALITARLASDQGRDVFAIPGNVTSAQSAGTNRLIQDGARLVRSAADILAEIPGLAPSAPVPQLPLDDEEKEILGRIPADVPVHVDALSSELGIPPSRLLVSLLALELKKRVRQLPGKLFLRRL